MRSDSWFCAPILIIYNCEIMGGRNTFFFSVGGAAVEENGARRSKQRLS